MPGTALPPLHEWESFYVIVGSSAAALTGLMFVVVALSSEARREQPQAALRAFATPTIVHFGAVLLIAAFLTTPGQTADSLRLCFLLSGTCGLGYVIWVTSQALRQRSYKPQLEDWIWHNILPVVAYATLLFAGFRLARAPETALYLVEAVAILLLFIGIHNSWDSATWLASQKGQKP